MNLFEGKIWGAAKSMRHRNKVSAGTMKDQHLDALLLMTHAIVFAGSNLCGLIALDMFSNY